MELFPDRAWHGTHIVKMNCRFFNISRKMREAEWQEPEGFMLTREPKRRIPTACYRE